MSDMRHGWTATAVALAAVVALGGCARTTENPDSVAAATACDPDRGTPQAPAGFRSLDNPLTVDAATIAAGRTLYEQTARPVACAQCHGVTGNGQGPLARHLDPKPSNFNCDFYAAVPDGQLFWITREGSNFMTAEPGYADVQRPGRRARATAMRPHRYHLSETETWQVIAYLRTFHADEDG